MVNKHLGIPGYERGPFPLFMYFDFDNNMGLKTGRYTIYNNGRDKVNNFLDF